MLEGDDVFEDESENGYLDDFLDGESFVRDRSANAADLGVAENVETGEGGDSDIPEYTLSPGCTVSTVPPLLLLTCWSISLTR